jgi:hypothetical protein
MRKAAVVEIGFPQACIAPPFCELNRQFPTVIFIKKRMYLQGLMT